MYKKIVAKIFLALGICFTISLTSQAQLTVNPTATPSTVCAGNSVQLNAGTSGSPGPYTYSWTSSASAFTSTNANPNDNPSSTTTYSVDVTDLTTLEFVTGQVAVTVNSPVSAGISISASSNPVCSGNSVNFTATPVNQGISPTYQWKVNGSNAGSNSPSFSYIPSNNDAVQCFLTSSLSCVTNNPASSNMVIMTVNSSLTPSVSVSASSNPVCSGSSVTFTATPTNGGISPSYQWKVNGSNRGSNSPTFAYTPVNGDVVTVVLTSSSSCAINNPATSPAVTMTVNTPSPVSVTISASPSGAFCSGTSVTFTATPVNGGSPSYQWRINGSNVGSNSSTFTTTALNNNDVVTVVMTSSLSCISGNPDTSNPITATVNPLPTATLTSSAAGNTFCHGTSVTFTASGGATFDFLVNGTSVQNGSGTTFTTSTLTNGQIVSVVVTNASGCSATASITNTVNPTPVATLTSSAAGNSSCTGASVTFTASGGNDYDFRIGGQSVQHSSVSTYTTSTLVNGDVVSVIVTNSSLCSATSPSITNAVHPLPVPVITSSDADNTFCAGTSVTFTASGGAAYNFRVAGNSVQNGSSPTFTTSAITNNQVVDVIVISAFGCSATSAGITNTVIPQPVANAGAGGNACNLTFNLRATASTGTGTWSKATGPGTVSFSPNDHTANSTVTVSDFGTYTFTWTETNGQCTNSSTVTVNFYVQPVANAGTGGNNCGLILHLNGTMNTGTGTWAKVAGPGNVTFSPNANTPNATATVTAYGTYTFSWTVVNGSCSNSSNVNIVFMQQLPAVGGTGGNKCDKNFVFNATTPVSGTGTWTKFSGPGSAVFTPDNHLPTATVTVDQSGTYDFAWTVDNGVCSSNDIVRVVFHDPPLLNAGKDTATCTGNKIQLQATGSGSVLWTPAVLLNSASIINPIASPSVTTTFSVTLTDQFGCKNTDAVIVEVRQKVVANAGPDQSLGFSVSTNLNAHLAYSYERGIWSLVSGAGDVLEGTNPTTRVNNLGKGINKFLWTVSNGVCPISSDTTNIIVNDFVIPTLISPNMDGKNDYFIIRGLSALTKAELVIFDRRGLEVYKNLNYDNSWNGVDYNKKPLPDDTYFYVLKISNGVSKSGFIVIRR